MVRSFEMNVLNMDVVGDAIVLDPNGNRLMVHTQYFVTMCCLLIIKEKVTTSSGIGDLKLAEHGAKSAKLFGCRLPAENPLQKRAAPV